MDQAARILAKWDIPAQLEMLLEHVCHQDNGVETTSTAQILHHQHLVCRVLEARYFGMLNKTSFQL